MVADDDSGQSGDNQIHIANSIEDDDAESKIVPPEHIESETEPKELQADYTKGGNGGLFQHETVDHTQHDRIGRSGTVSNPIAEAA